METQLAPKVKDYGTNNSNAYAHGECDSSDNPSPVKKHNFHNGGGWGIGRCYTGEKCCYCGALHRVDSSD